MRYDPPGEETLKALEKAPNIYLVLSPDLFILTASDLYLEATHSKRELIVGKYIFDAFPDNPDLADVDSVQNINASLQEVLSKKIPHHMRIQRYDVPDVDNPGQFIQRYWDPSHTPVFKEDGTIHYIIQLANNVTGRVLAEQAMAEQIKALEKLEMSEKHFRHLADIVPSKISNALPTGEVTFFNQHWMNYAGMNFEDLRDFGYHQMMHPDEIPVFQAQLAEAAAKSVALESEMRFKDINGHYRWHLNIASPVLNEKGEITMWVGSTTDIQRMKDEDQLRSDFIGMVSHELKTPLTTLSGYLQLLDSKAGESSDQLTRQSLEQSLKQVRKMTTMINGFLNVSRLESGKMSIDKTVFDVRELFAEMEAETFQMSMSHKIIFTCHSSAPVFGDRDKIGQVLNNLVSNAVKYSKTASTIQISCRINEKNLEIAVSDQGMGIRPEDLNHVFERYYRAQNHAQLSGFGIGLYLSAEIIKRHDGKIWAESEADKGSTFYFRLPLL